MLTKERTSKNRKFKYVAVALALLSVLVFCLASCGEAVPAGVEYVAGTAQKVEYNEGESFDCTGAQIKVTYDNGVTETKNVTVEMVGNAPLTIGAQSVMVTYSEGGKTVVGYIPVTVKDPHMTNRTEALSAIYTNDLVKAYPTDAGILALVTEYSAKVNAAADAAAINIVVDNFDAAVKAYDAAKQNVLAQLEAIDYSVLHFQFAQDIESVKAQAKQNIRGAASVELAKEYLANFATYVANKISEQEFLEKPETNEGQIYDKMDILRAIRNYQDKVDFLIEIVQNAHDTDPTYPAEVYNAKMYGVEDGVDGYEEIRAYLVERYNYITLAINIAGQMEAIDSTVKELLTTPIDRLVALLTSAENGADVVVYPAEYVVDEDAFVDGLDVTKALLNQLKDYDGLNAEGEDEVVDYQTQAAKEFGTEGLATLLAGYGMNSATGNTIVEELIATIEAKYEDLMAIRADAVAQNVIALINTAATTELGTAKADAINAAWAAYKAWGVANGVFTVGEANQYNDNVVYGSIYNGEYSVTLIGGKWNSSAMGTWSAYDFTGKKFVEEATSYISTYFIPNLDLLLTATQEQDAFEVKETTDKIATVILSNTDADDKAEIEAARAALEAYRTFYYKDNAFLANKLDVTEATIAAAETRYAELVTKANTVNTAIDTYEAYLNGENHGAVKLEDYRDNGLLAVAYKEYREFAAMNTDVIGGVEVIYTDVITDADVTTDGANNEVNLLKFVDAYFAMEYMDQRVTVSRGTIAEALDAKLLTVSATAEDYRTALNKYYVVALAEIFAGADLDYSTTFVDEDGEVVLTIDKFNRIDIYEANYARLLEAVAEVVANITDATGVDESGNLVYATE